VSDVVLLHGQPGGPLDWRRVARTLRPHHAVHAPDRRGYGRNPLGPGGLHENAEDVVRLLDERGVESAVVAGHSWGGGVALAMAQGWPGRVRGLVLVSSVGPECLVTLDRALAARWMGDALSWAAFRAAGPVVRRRLRRALEAEADAAERAEAEESLAANAARPLWRTFLVEQRALIEELPEVNARLGRVRAPTVVLAGERDRVVPARTARALAAAIPGAELRLLPASTHELPQAAPEAVAAAIDSVAAVPST
jgi:pimeloyl-ACP methyl ester carboxylesterase